MEASHTPAVVGIIMGSQSDWSTMQEAATLLEQLNIPFEAKIVSAHRTPKRLYDYAETAEQRGLKVIIAGAGGAAHLPGMTAAMTHLPVLGVPVQSKALSGPGIIVEPLRCAVGTDDFALERDAELLQQERGLLHGAPVGLAAHDDTDDGG